MGPFLATLWLYAVYVDAHRASILGYLYVGLRAVYPLLMGSSLGRMVRLGVLLSTIPQYVPSVWACVASVVLGPTWLLCNLWHQREASSTPT